jgi:hypothetical protein
MPDVNQIPIPVEHPHESKHYPDDTPETKAITTDDV